MENSQNAHSTHARAHARSTYRACVQWTRPSVGWTACARTWPIRCRRTTQDSPPTGRWQLHDWWETTGTWRRSQIHSAISRHQSECSSSTALIEIKIPKVLTSRIIRQNSADKRNASCDLVCLFLRSNWQQRLIAARNGGNRKTGAVTTVLQMTNEKNLTYRQGKPSAKFAVTTIHAILKRRTAIHQSITPKRRGSRQTRIQSVNEQSSCHDVDVPMCDSIWTALRCQFHQRSRQQCFSLNWDATVARSAPDVIPVRLHRQDWFVKQREFSVVSLVVLLSTSCRQSRLSSIHTARNNKQQTVSHEIISVDTNDWK